MPELTERGARRDKEPRLNQETLNTIASFLALFFVYTLFHGYRLFTTKVNNRVDATSAELAKVQAKLEKTESEFIAYRLEAQYQAGKRESDILHLKEQITTLEKHKNDLANLLRREQAERAKEKAEYELKIEGLNKRIIELETQKPVETKAA